MFDRSRRSGGAGLYRHALLPPFFPDGTCQSGKIMMQLPNILQTRNAIKQCSLGVAKQSTMTGGGDPAVLAIAIAGSCASEPDRMTWASPCFMQAPCLCSSWWLARSCGSGTCPAAATIRPGFWRPFCAPTFHWQWARLLQPSVMHCIPIAVPLVPSAPLKQPG